MPAANEISFDLPDCFHYEYEQNPQKCIQLRAMQREFWFGLETSLGQDDWIDKRTKFNNSVNYVWKHCLDMPGVTKAVSG